MRKIFVVLSLILSVCLLEGAVSAAGAEEVLLARIAGVDREKGELHLEVIAGSLNRAAGATGGEAPMTVSFSETQAREWNLDQLEAGTVVRVWGEKGEAPQTSGFLVQDIRPAFGSIDPTGVRGRLGRGRHGFGGGFGGPDRGGRGMRGGHR